MERSRTLHITIERDRVLIMVGLISVFAQHDSKIQRGLLSCRLNAVNISSNPIVLLITCPNT